MTHRFDSVTLFCTQCGQHLQQVRNDLACNTTTQVRAISHIRARQRIMERTGVKLPLRIIRVRTESY